MLPLSRTLRRCSAAATLSHVVVRAASGKALTFSRFGDPFKVLSLQDAAASKPGAKQVRVKMLAAPIHASDLDRVQGTYATTPALPAVAGVEGVGVVEEVGSGVKSVQKGATVITNEGTWQSHAVVGEDSLISVPSDIDAETASVLSVNPCTAVRLLEDFQTLKPGDVVIQNGANSMVGQAVIQIAKSRGITTVNVVRDKGPSDPTVEMLKSIGGDVVVTDSYIRTPAFKNLMADLAPPVLGLNCVGARVATDVARNLAEGGKFVTYGAMSKRPLQLPASLLLFRNITCHGFWLARWVQQNGVDAHRALVSDVASMVQSGTLKFRLEAHKLEQYEDALRAAVEHRDSRKVVLSL